MKVVLFCGGLGMRMRDGVTTGPKPMAMVGERPLLWHVMRYYAHFGHTDFVLCLGYGASHVKDFFLSYDETRSNDFALENGAREVKLFSTDISDWRITFVDTGLHSAIGERLRRVRRFVEGEAMFMANYADVLTNVSLPDMIDRFEASSAVASLLAVPPQSSHHVVEIADDGLITQVTPMRDLRQWENGGYFLLRPEIFDHLNEGEDLVEDVIMRRLVPRGRAIAYPYKGYWSPADTVKERAQLDEMYHRGNCPWMIWDQERSSAGAPADSSISEHPLGGNLPADICPGRSDHPVLSLHLEAPAGRPLSLLVIGAHPDDIEIGAGGMLLSLAAACPGLHARYLVMTGTAERHQEARSAASAFLPGADVRVDLHGLPEGRFPAVWAQVKDALEKVARSCSPDVILAPSRADAHQDHRTLGEIVPTVFRDQLYLGYEIPKWDGDLGKPSMYFPLSAEVARSKVELLHKCFPSQRVRDWWDDEVFLGLARLRGMECRAPYAEAFTCTKSAILPPVLAPGSDT